jgi:hypothetical protein
VSTFAIVGPDQWRMTPTAMTPRNAHFTGARVAECPDCHSVCAGWDEDDLDDEGRLLCWHD